MTTRTTDREIIRQDVPLLYDTNVVLLYDVWVPLLADIISWTPRDQRTTVTTTYSERIKPSTVWTPR